MAEQAYVELKHINKTFGTYRASDDVCFSVEKGKLIGLLGPSGSGKTTISDSALRSKNGIRRTSRRGWMSRLRQSTQKCGKSFAAGCAN